MQATAAICEETARLLTKGKNFRGSSEKPQGAFREKEKTPPSWPAKKKGGGGNCKPGQTAVGSSPKKGEKRKGEKAPLNKGGPGKKNSIKAEGGGGCCT